MDCTKSVPKKMNVEVKIRAYDEAMDLHRADELEKQCEAGPGGGASLFTDLLGDPLCRVRQYPAFAMLVAETLPDKELVGLVRAGVKEVACTSQSMARVSHSSEGSACKSEQSTTSDNEDSTTPCLAPSRFVSIAYILGLRVAPKCRRLGIGAELVKKMEEWCKDRGAEYVYIATEKDNEASVGLFTKKLGYAKFRNPAILVQPVYVQSKKLSKKVQVVELSKEEACKLYNNPTLFGNSEFLPKDIEAVVKSSLHRGTWLAFWKNRDDDDRGGGGRLQRLHSMCSMSFAHPGCFGSKSGIREIECKDGRNERRMRRFHGVLDSSGVCEFDRKEKDGGCIVSECMVHATMDSSRMEVISSQCKEDATHGTACEDDDGVQKMDGELNSGFDPTLPLYHAHASAISHCPHLSMDIDHSSAVSAASSWAMLSLWKCNEIYQLEMKGAPLRLRGAAAASRAVGRMLSWLAPVPTMPDVFKPFGLQLIYGMRAQGPRGSKLGRHLCWLAHNLAKEDGCAVVAAEVASCDPLRGIIPHWTCDEDMWCIKRLLATSDSSSADVDTFDWCNLPAPDSLFLDPRDF